MRYTIPPVADHVEPTPEEVNVYRKVAGDHIRQQGIDQGVTTCIVLTLYRGDKQWRELRGITNPGLLRFRAVIIDCNSCTLSFETGKSFRPAYDERMANRRSKE